VQGVQSTLHGAGAVLCRRLLDAHVYEQGDEDDYANASEDRT